MTQQEFLSRRQALLAQMQPGSAALIFAAPKKQLPVFRGGQL